MSLVTGQFSYVILAIPAPSPNSNFLSSDFLHDVYGVFAVDFGQFYLNYLIIFSRDFLADEICLDGQFAMPPIDQNRELNRAHSAEVAKRIQSRAYCPAGV